MDARSSATVGLAARQRRLPGQLSCLLSGLAYGLVLVTSGPLQAAETVLFNQSAAHQCYLAALRGADAREVDICNAAIEHQSLQRPDFAATLSNRGLLLARSGNYEEALRDHARAIEIAPDLAGLYINRSNAYTRAGRFDESIKDLDRAVELASPAPAGTDAPVPDTTSQLAAAYYNRALLRHRVGDLDAALADAMRARDTAPDRESYRRYALDLERLRAGAKPDATD